MPQYLASSSSSLLDNCNHLRKKDFSIIQVGFLEVKHWKFTGNDWERVVYVNFGLLTGPCWLCLHCSGMINLESFQVSSERVLQSPTHHVPKSTRQLEEKHPQWAIFRLSGDLELLSNPGCLQNKSSSVRKEGWPSGDSAFGYFGFSGQNGQDMNIQGSFHGRNVPPES